MATTPTAARPPRLKLTRSAAPGNVDALAPPAEAEVVLEPDTTAVVAGALTMLDKVLAARVDATAVPSTVDTKPPVPVGVTVLPKGAVPVIMVPLMVEVTSQLLTEPVCWEGGPRMMLPAEFVEVTTEGFVELELEPEEPPLPSSTENWVEYWNSPVPSTMIKSP